MQYETRYNQVPLQRGPIYHYITHGTAMTAEHVSDFNLTRDTPHLALTGELWGVYCEDFGENWPHHNGTALFHNAGASEGETINL